MKSRLFVAIFVIGLLTLAGCASAPPPQAATPTEASKEQVASVIAKRKSEWSKVIAEALDCRTAWINATADTLPGTAAATCYTQEKTIGNTSQAAIRELNDLSIPSSMSALVSDTKLVLQDISDINIANPCGFDPTPKLTEECMRDLGERNAQYKKLSAQLDAWSPYL